MISMVIFWYAIMPPKGPPPTKKPRTQKSDAGSASSHSSILSTASKKIIGTVLKVTKTLKAKVTRSGSKSQASSQGIVIFGVTVFFSVANCQVQFRNLSMYHPMVTSSQHRLRRTKLSLVCKFYLLVIMPLIRILRFLAASLDVSSLLVLWARCHCSLRQWS